MKHLLITLTAITDWTFTIQAIARGQIVSAGKRPICNAFPMAFQNARIMLLEIAMDQT